MPPRKKVLIYGNCQAPLLSLLLNRSPSIAARFEFVTVMNHAAPGGEAEPVPPEADDAVLVWEQYDERNVVPVREELRRRIPAACPVLVYPPLNAMGLWPFAWAESRNAPEPGYPWGRYPWGDRIGLEIAKLDLPADEVFDAYMKRSLEKMPDVVELVHRDRVLGERRDAASDVTIDDYISEHLLTEHMFWTWGHTSSALGLELTRRLFLKSEEVLGPLTPQIEREMAAAAEQYPGIGFEQLPIHPEVVRRLGIAFCDDETRYRWFDQEWTFREYITRYVTFDRSW
ncbi:MAG: hypothetical protein JWO85_112 [Candidatus Eremiobacteraeota bacterium]|nr:hypothetical protein [Candidatus Eremiobacteraeota bacterium]